MIPLNLAGKEFSIVVFIVDQNVPFLIGGGFLRNIEARIDMKTPPLMLKDGREVKRKTLKSGHLSIPWVNKLHEKPKISKVLLSERVSQKDYNTPEVREAMEKEMRNL